MNDSDFSDVAERRLIFSINSGRSGSKYLAQLLATAANVTSFHEAEPQMAGEYLAMVNAADFAQSRAPRRIKAQAIARTLRGTKPDETYAETNHMFIKTFFDVVLEAFRNVDVIILRRDLALVLKSFIEMGYFSPLNPQALRWMSSPNSATAALRPIGADADLDQYDAAIAYLLDIEARALRFQREYPAVRTHEVRLEELNDSAAVEDLFQRLNLSATTRTSELCGQRVNDRPHRKEHFRNPTTVQECRARLAAYVEKAKRLGIEIPPSAALELE